jgi:hypothetical protein
MAALCHGMPETHKSEKSDCHIRYHQGKFKRKHIPLGHGSVAVHNRQQVAQPVTSQRKMETGYWQSPNQWCITDFQCPVKKSSPT